MDMDVQLGLCSMEVSNYMCNLVWLLNGQWVRCWPSVQKVSGSKPAVSQCEFLYLLSLSITVNIFESDEYQASIVDGVHHFNLLYWHLGANR
jgi:hypothetical protein